MNITSVTKKLATTLAAVVAIALASTPSHAFSSISKSTFTATVALTQTGSASMVASLFFTATNAANAGSIGFGTPTLPAAFVGSDSYIKLTGNVTAGNGSGVQIYTDNTNALASPKFLNALTLNPAGLVSANGLSALPMAWSVKPSTSTPPAIVTPNQTGQPITDTAYQWQYFEDKAQTVADSGTLFANAAPYIMVKTAGGIQSATASFFGGGGATGYIYTEADFTTASTPNTYGTNMLMLEAFTQ
jgi:hypothetical protein